MFRLIKYKTVGEDLTKSMDFDFWESVIFFLDCATVINGEKIPDPWTPTNSVRWRDSNTVEVQLPSLMYYLLAKH